MAVPDHRLAWLLIGVLVLRFNVTSVRTVGILLGAMFRRGVQRIPRVDHCLGGWKFVHIALGVPLHPGVAVGASSADQHVLRAGVRARVPARADGIDAHRRLRAVEGVEPSWWLGLTVGILEILLAMWVSQQYYGAHRADPDLGRVHGDLPRHQRDRDGLRAASRRRRAWKRPREPWVDPLGDRAGARWSGRVGPCRRRVDERRRRRHDLDRRQYLDTRRGVGRGADRRGRAGRGPWPRSRFQEDGMVGGSSGCNTLRAAPTRLWGADGSPLDPPRGPMTETACEEPLMRPETATSLHGGRPRSIALEDGLSSCGGETTLTYTAERPVALKGTSCESTPSRSAAMPCPRRSRAPRRPPSAGQVS